MTSVRIHRSRVSLEIAKSKEIEMSGNGVFHIARRQDREALRLNVEVVDKCVEHFHQGHVPANALPSTEHSADID